MTCIRNWVIVEYLDPKDAEIKQWTCTSVEFNHHDRTCLLINSRIGISHKIDITQLFRVEPLDSSNTALGETGHIGTWIKTGQSFIDPNKFLNFCCSNCHEDLDEHIRVKPKFCPNCGASMR